MLRIVAACIFAPALTSLGVIAASGHRLHDLFPPGFSAAQGPLPLLSLGFTLGAMCGPVGHLLQMTELERP